MKRFAILIILLASMKSIFGQNLSIEELTVKAEAGNAEAQNNLGSMFFFGEGVLKNTETAFYWFEKSAKQGNSYAQYNTGLMYSSGQGVLKDPEKAFYWYKKSAEQGDSYAQYLVGYMYYFGEGVLKDLGKSAYWIKEAFSNTQEDAQKDAQEFWEENELWKYNEE